MNKLQFFLCISILMNASIFQAIDIFHAISRGNIKTVNAWVKLNSNLSICNEQGQSVLHAAVLANNKNI
ncbi:MAG TPA: ankyrin repeat domain-containing protein, partial [Candidatus Saccharimonadales bacterium]|nr:ankyrin repeat domain-containing protein [Candidatus Saccharimonadales bacterium]